MIGVLDLKTLVVFFSYFAEAERPCEGRNFYRKGVRHAVHTELVSKILWIRDDGLRKVLFTESTSSWLRFCSIRYSLSSRLQLRMPLCCNSLLGRYNQATSVLTSCYRSVPTKDDILVPETLLKKRKSQEKEREQKAADLKKKREVRQYSILRRSSPRGDDTYPIPTRL